MEIMKWVKKYKKELIAGGLSTIGIVGASIISARTVKKADYEKLRFLYQKNFVDFIDIRTGELIGPDEFFELAKQYFKNSDSIGVFPGGDRG